MLKIYTTPNHFKNARKKYSFRSQNAHIITQDEIIQAIAEANTTITAADTVAVLKVLEQVFKKEIENGNVVELFMGRFYAGASGTTDERTEAFKPIPSKDPRTPKRNHKIDLHYEPEKNYKKSLQYIQTKRIHTPRLCAPKLHTLDYCGYPYKDKIEAGDTVIIKGDFIKFDANDLQQGVFFENAETHKSYRAKVYFRCTRVTVSAQLPEEVTPGIYLAVIINKDMLRTSSQRFTVHAQEETNTQ